MSDCRNWKIIIPTEKENLCTNPSVETNSIGWSTGGTNTLTRVTSNQKFGLYGLEATYSNSLTMAGYSLASFVVNNIYFFGCWVYVNSDFGANVEIDVNQPGASTIETSRATTTVKGRWVYLSLTFQATTIAPGSLEINALTTPTAAKKIYIDGACVYDITSLDVGNSTSEFTTTIGDEPGSFWLGTPHASKSKRRKLESSGGLLLSLEDDLNFKVTESPGAGAVSQIVDGVLWSQKSVEPLPRIWQLQGMLTENELTALHDTRQALIKAYSSYADLIDQLPRSFFLQYEAGEIKQIKAAYNGRGLGFSTLGRNANNEPLSTDLISYDPFFYELGNSAKTLDTQGSATLRTVAGILDGQWDALGPPSIPGTAVYTSVEAVIATKNNKILFGGDFTNFDNQANADYIVRYDPENESYSPIGTGLNGVVKGFGLASDGDIYVVGQFTNAGGVANADYIAKLNPDSDTFTAVGNPSSGGAAITSIIDVVEDWAGNVVIVGDFTNLSGVATADHIAYYNGSSWNGIVSGSSTNGAMRAIAIDKRGRVFVGGQATNIGGITASPRIARLDSSFNAIAVGTGFNSGQVLDFAVGEDNTLYIAGSATITGGQGIFTVGEANVINELGGGIPAGTIYHVAVRQNGEIFVSGNMLTIGDDNLDTSGGAYWDGSSWRTISIDLNPASSYFIDSVELNRNVYAGGVLSAASATNYGGRTTITYAGSERAWPKIYIKATGTTTEDIKLVKLFNALTESALYFDFNMLIGETIVINTKPSEQFAVSDRRGELWDIAISGTSRGDFYLLPGTSGNIDNDIIFSLQREATVTITAWAEWKDTFNGLD